MRKNIVCTLSAALVLAAMPVAFAKDSTARSVSAAIERAAAAKTQDEEQAAFDEIVALGCRAVPEVANHLGDTRVLPVPYLRLVNDDKNAFEQFRQYGPSTVTDALAAILNHLTWKHFGFIYNGASEKERVEAIRLWRKYIRETPKERLCAKKAKGG
jgi:hypothetical protein